MRGGRCHDHMSSLSSLVLCSDGQAVGRPSVSGVGHICCRPGEWNTLRRVSVLDLDLFKAKQIRKDGGYVRVSVLQITKEKKGRRTHLTLTQGPK